MSNSTFEAIAREAVVNLSHTGTVYGHELNVGIILAAITKANEGQKLPDKIRSAGGVVLSEPLYVDDQQEINPQCVEQLLAELEKPSPFEVALTENATLRAENQKLREALLPELTHKIYGIRQAAACGISMEEAERLAREQIAALASTKVETQP